MEWKEIEIMMETRIIDKLVVPSLLSYFADVEGGTHSRSFCPDLSHTLYTYVSKISDVCLNILLLQK